VAADIFTSCASWTLMHSFVNRDENSDRRGVTPGNWRPNFVIPLKIQCDSQVVVGARGSRAGPGARAAQTPSTSISLIQIR